MPKHVQGLRFNQVRERYNIRPSELRRWQEHGLIKPPLNASRQPIYTEAVLERLEMVLTLTRDLGVNLPGVVLIMSLRDRLELLENPRIIRVRA